MSPLRVLPRALALAAFALPLAACAGADDGPTTTDVAADSPEGAALTNGSGACFSGTLGREVAVNSCVLSKYDGRWYQCHVGHWVDRWTDPDACVFPGVTPPPPPPPPPSQGGNVGAVGYHHGGDVGFGVGYKDVPGASGDGVFIGYAGYGITQGSAEAWVDELYRAVLGRHGVRYLYAVGGPNEPTYANREVGNTRLIASMLPKIKGNSHVIVAGHSSGAFVANELVSELAHGSDPQGITGGRVVYFNLEGDPGGLDAGAVGRLRRLYFVSARDGGITAPNYFTMERGGSEFASRGGFFALDAGGSGCQANWCVHVSLVISRPHESWGADRARDYSDFAGRPVEHRWLDAKAGEAGLW